MDFFSLTFTYILDKLITWDQKDEIETKLR